MKTVLSLILLTSLAAPTWGAASEASCRQLLLSKLGAYPTPAETEAYFRDAESAYRDCRDPKLPLDIRVRALMNYGAARDLRGEAQAAAGAFGQAITLLDGSSDDQTGLLIEALDGAVGAELHARLRSDAITHAERSLSLRKAKFGDASAEAVTGTIKVAVVFGTFGDYGKSESLLSEAIRSAQTTCGPQCDPLSEAYSAMYALYEAQGKADEAKRYDRLALDAKPPETRESRTKH